MAHEIRILSVNKYKEIEWREVVKSGTKSGATRKANNIIRSCGHDPKTFAIDKHQIGSSHERWVI